MSNELAAMIESGIFDFDDEPHVVHVRRDPADRCWIVQHGDNPEAVLRMPTREIVEGYPEAIKVRLSEWLREAHRHQPCAS